LEFLKLNLLQQSSRFDASKHDVPFPWSLTFVNFTSQHQIFGINCP